MPVLRGDESEEFDFIRAILKIPKGESLSPSRRSDDAFRALVHGKDGLQHAEVFLPTNDDDAEESAREGSASRPGEPGRAALQGAMGAVVVAAAAVGTYKSFVLVRRKLRERKARRRLFEAENLTGQTTVDVAAALIEVQDSETGAELAERGVAMSEEEWQQRFRLMLMADAFRVEQWRLLSHAVVEGGGEQVLEAQMKMREMRGQDVANRLSSAAGGNGDVLGEDRAPVVPRVVNDGH